MSTRAHSIERKRTRERKRYRTWIRPVVTLAFLSLVFFILAEKAREIHWSDVGTSIRTYGVSELFVAFGLTAMAYAFFVSYDLLSKRYTSHTLKRGLVATIAYVSYAFNLSLGAIIGGMSFRYLLYSRFGLSLPTITRVVGFSVLTNWLGYIFVAGLILVLAPPRLPSDWALGERGLILLGGLFLAMAASYMGLCAFSRRREWRIRNTQVRLPSFPLALSQLVLATCNWLATAGVVLTLLRADVSYPDVLAALLVSGLAGVLTHIPAGLGVMEAVFLALLGGRVESSRIVASLLAYRAVFYLVPLLLGVLLFFALQAKAPSKSILKESRHNGGQ